MAQEKIHTIHIEFKCCQKLLLKYMMLQNRNHKMCQKDVKKKNKRMRKPKTTFNDLK